MLQNPNESVTHLVSKIIGRLATISNNISADWQDLIPILVDNVNTPQSSLTLKSSSLESLSKICKYSVCKRRTLYWLF
jgi:hypothetical protein